VEPSNHNPGQPIHHESRSQGQLEELTTTLMRGKWTAIITFLVVFGAMALYTFLSKPIYEATSMVLVDARGRENHLQFLDITGASNTTKITNELETLKARSTVEAVARDLLSQVYLDTTTKRVIPIIKMEVDPRPRNARDSLALVADRLQQAVDFSPVKDSDIIRILVRSTNAEEAALLANTYTKVYGNRNMSASRIKSRSLREFLQSQMESKHTSLDSTERAMQTYMRNSGVVSLDAEASKVVDQLSALEATRDGIEVDISTRAKTLNSLKQELATQEPAVAKAIGESNDTYIRLLQEQMARLQVQRDVVIAQNPELADEKIYSEKLREIDAQIESLKKNLKARTEAYLTTLGPGDRMNGAEGATAGFLSQVKQRIIEQQIELDGLKARKDALGGVIKEYERQFNQIPQKSIELAKLQRARLSSEKLYLLVEEKYNEAAITETSELGYVSVMDPAAVPRSPVSPKIVINLLMGAMLGVFAGVGLVIILARLDDRIKSPEDLKRYGVTPIATIGVIPTTKPGDENNTFSLQGEAGPLDEHLVSFFCPLSSIAEGYRHLRTSVQYDRPDQPTGTIVVTSTTPEEGKSTTVCNLAISFSQAESRVLLVDADLRRPRTHELFGLKREPGLTDILFGKKSFEQVVHRKALENLDILSCGTIPPNPSEILSSRKMRELVERLKSTYDVVLFDAPPMLAVTDPAILARIVDVVLIVVRAGHTSLKSLDRAAEMLQGVNKAPTGIVLNGFDMLKAYGRYQQDHYSYGYGYTSGGNGARKRTKSPSGV
jgi:capsular exopolysaccharide synthesis family protein